MSACAHLFLLGGGGSSGPPPNPPPNPDAEVVVELVIFRPPPPGSLIANVSPSFKLKSFFGPEGRCGEGASSSISDPSEEEDGLAARVAAAFCRLPKSSNEEGCQ